MKLRFPPGSACAITTVALLLLGSPTLLAQQRHSRNKIDLGLQDALRKGASTERVIITVDAAARRDIRKALQAHGDRITSENALVSSLSAEVHSGDVAVLADHPSVRSVSLDATVTAGSDSGFESARARKMLRGSLAKDPFPDRLRDTLGLPHVASSTTPTGRGVVVALIDSGIQPNGDVPADRIEAFYDFTRGGLATEPYDDYGHGTHVAGLIGASGALSGLEFQGVAPDVSFVGLKVLDDAGQGHTSDVLDAIQFIVDNNDRLHVDVINLSLGHPIFAPAADDPLVQAVEQAVAHGIVVVASAGNFGQSLTTGHVGYAGITSPGDAPSAITVGAADTRNTVRREDDSVAAFSSRGPTWYDAFAKPDVVAPGVRLVSDAVPTSTLYRTLAGSRKQAGNRQVFLELTGTSMATAVTSGEVALVIDANRRAGYSDASPLAPNVVKAIVEYTAIKLPDADVLTQGAGEINAAGAMALGNAIDPSAGAGEWWLRNSIPDQTVLVDHGRQRTYSWSANIVWGDNIVWGNLLFYNLATWSANIVWGDNIVWGNDLVWANDVSWRDVSQVAVENIVWANDIVWANNIVWGGRLIGMSDGTNIVWGDLNRDNIVWGNLNEDNIVWGNLADDNIVWGNVSNDNIVWGNNIVWGLQSTGNNIVWGDNIVWGNSAQGGGLF
ncbi:MAG: S8 family peptidase [Betaproteobacteria bacterium]